MEIKDLLTVKGKQGLWTLVKVIPKANMARIQNIVSDEAATIKIADISSLKNYRIFLENGKDLTLEDIFVSMSEVEEKKSIKFTPGNFEAATDAEKAELMELAVPTYDKLQFKSYHMVKIIKWYNDINIALDREAELNALLEDTVNLLKGDVVSEEPTENLNPEN